MPSPILETQSVTRTFGEGGARVVALEDVTVTLARKEVLLIMGPSGSGKTTLLSIMDCNCVGGRVIVNDKDE
ncbi:MAG: putative ABC transport system ATP-binding protein [Gammaproteobacteria bacterium]|nr:MAG: putative ABC transport system ATP-binding protein [Gammaproteobacteria bacterium]TND05535.1 MAG: putative ABC transport system ATP-binding protein [Gammaproteobacteria bacterium]